MFRGEWQKAIETLARHLTLPSAVWADERCASMRYIARCLRALEQDDSAERWLHRAIAEAPHLRRGVHGLRAAPLRAGALVRAGRCAARALAHHRASRTYICVRRTPGKSPTTRSRWRMPTSATRKAPLPPAARPSSARRRRSGCGRILPSLSKCASGDARAFLRSVYSVFLSAADPLFGYYLVE